MTKEAVLKILRQRGYVLVEVGADEGAVFDVDGDTLGTVKANLLRDLTDHPREPVRVHSHRGDPCGHCGEAKAYACYREGEIEEVAE